MNSELLRISNLYGGYKESVNILRGIDMIVHEGESMGIIGLNGSGKSTLGKAIMNMIPYRNGEITFEGRDIARLKTDEIARAGISIMLQGGRVFQNLSVWDNMELAFRGAMKTSFAQLQETIPILQEPKRKLQSTIADKLSGGQKHQLALAMVLAASPKLLILDEPSAGLDPKSVEEMYKIMGRTVQENRLSIILIEQNVSKAMEHCDCTIMLQLGQAICVDDMDELERLMFCSH